MHLVLVDLRESEIDGQQAEDRLHEIGITVNRNAVPFDPRPPMVTSGPARRHERARHARPAGRGLRRGRRDHRDRADARLRGPPRRAGRARHGDRRRATRSTSTYGASRRAVRRWTPPPGRATSRRGAPPTAATASRSARAGRGPRLRRGLRGRGAADARWPRGSPSRRGRRQPARARAGEARHAAARRPGDPRRRARGAAPLFLNLDGEIGERMQGILAGGALITLVGALDDRFDLRAAGEDGRPDRRGGDPGRGRASRSRTSRCRSSARSTSATPARR